MASRKRKHICSGDRISQLPEPILHHILSFLSQKEALQTSVLSKSWRDLGSTRPNIDFRVAGDDESFDFALETALSCCRDRNLRITQFSVEILQAEHVSFMEEYIQDVFSGPCGGPTTFSLNITLNSGRYSFFDLPPAVLESDSLRSLSLTNCRLNFNPAESVVRFKHLNSLFLNWVIIHNETLERFILPGCPLVKRVELISCFGPTTIRLNHGCLEHFHFQEARGLNKPAFEIIFEDTVPTLETINIKGLSNAWCINYPACFPFLRSLCLENVYLPMESFEISSADFPFLEHLSIKSCTGFDTFRLVNCLVRHLTIWVSRKQVLSEIKIDAPVLEEFVYRPYVAGPISFSGETSTKMWKSSIHYLMFNMDRLAHLSQWFIDLRKLLEELSRSEISLILPIFQLNPFEFEPDNFENHHSHNNNPVVEFDYLELCFSGYSYSCLMHFLNCMLCYCRPRKIRTVLDGGTRGLVGFVCRMLLLGEKEKEEGKESCFWGQGLEGAAMNVFDEVCNEWLPVEGPRFLESAGALCPKDKQVQVCFRLKWKD
ncbi:F-box family protein [Striga asiatica]|uniref:F-box family protein n=1 Tax=Striga asiatica TaxID=4170 RepID=A0A5A7P659_STRAF|nr:F-box family protein [Striga asiatica]